MLIDYTYFAAYPFNVSNVDKVEVRTLLEQVIAVKEAECLEALLGRQLFNLLNEWLQDKQTGDRFDKLVNGEAYTYAGQTYVFTGLANAETKASTAAGYVFYYYIDAVNTVLTGTGTQTSNPENATKAAPAELQTLALNTYANKAAHLVGYLTHKSSDFSEWVRPEKLPRKTNSLGI